MIPASRVQIVHNEPGHLEAHVAKARTAGKDVVDRWVDGSWQCTCYAAMYLGKRCDHIATVQAMVAARAS